MTVTITGAVIVGGVRYPCEAQIELPDVVSRETILRLVPKAS
jgi:hypothetical protein